MGHRKGTRAQSSPEFAHTGPQLPLQLSLWLLPCGNGWGGAGLGLGWTPGVNDPYILHPGMEVGTGEALHLPGSGDGLTLHPSP